MPQLDMLAMACMGASVGIMVLWLGETVGHVLGGMAVVMGTVRQGILMQSYEGIVMVGVASAV